MWPREADMGPRGDENVFFRATQHWDTAGYARNLEQEDLPQGGRTVLYITLAGLNCAHTILVPPARVNTVEKVKGCAIWTARRRGALLLEIPTMPSSCSLHFDMPDEVRM